MLVQSQFHIHIQGIETLPPHVMLSYINKRIANARVLVGVVYDTPDNILSLEAFDASATFLKYFLYEFMNRTSSATRGCICIEICGVMRHQTFI